MFLKKRSKPPPQFKKLLPGETPAAAAPGLYRMQPPAAALTLKDAERGVAPASPDAERLISLTAEATAQGTLFAGNPDRAYREIMAVCDKVRGFGHMALVAQSGSRTKQEPSEGIRLFAREVLPRPHGIPDVEVG